MADIWTNPVDFTFGPGAAAEGQRPVGSQRQRPPRRAVHVEYSWGRGEQLGTGRDDWKYIAQRDIERSLNRVGGRCQMAVRYAPQAGTLARSRPGGRLPALHVRTAKHWTQRDIFVEISDSVHIMGTRTQTQAADGEPRGPPGVRRVPTLPPATAAPAGGACDHRPQSLKVKSTGLVKNPGKLSDSNRDFQLNCPANSRILGQPCENQVLRAWYLLYMSGLPLQLGTTYGGLIAESHPRGARPRRRSI